MITHVIYHIPGRKVGCTKNLDVRKKWYKGSNGVVPTIEILEELYDKTDQEAGDIEWAWADKFGYKRGGHYTSTVAVTLTAEQRSEFARKGGHLSNGGRVTFELGVGIYAWTPEQRIANSRKAGLAAANKGTSFGGEAGRRKGRGRAAELGVTGFQTMTHDQHVNAGIKGGRKRFESMTVEQRSALGRLAARGGGGVQIGKCPHCGLESNISNLRRWHFDNCLKNPDPVVKFDSRPTIGGCLQRGACPHCGYEGLKMHLGRYHFDRCSKKPRRFVRMSPCPP